MNIKFHYLYRDGANYKQNHSEVFANQERIAVEEIEKSIKEALIDEMWFHVDQWLLKDLHRYEWDNEIDHDWHEYNSIEETEEEATMLDIADFIRLIQKRFTSPHL